ncbi:alcohol dehydrogenase catalytic domain-containing protein [Streptomyces sp. NPDC048558]|uniref:alcohol dehydrogenase catalytic domain-containing protein n=1 Tax=Streptomyces sp. NPDC048558 TaxID=3155759 RepID=UPI003411B76C
MQSVYHWTPMQAGLAILPMTLVNFVLAVQVPRLPGRVSRPRVLLIGVVLTTAGMVWLSRLDLHTRYVAGVALIGSALSLSILTAVAATISTGHGATDIAARSGAALTGSAILLSLAVVAVLTLIAPRHMGHEFLGVVEETVSEVHTLKPGDVVVAPFVWADNTCSYCREGRQTSCPHGGQWHVNGVDGGQGQAARVPHADGTLVILPSPRTPSC